MTTISKTELSAGLQNLLVNCAAVQAGESILIVREDPALGWYDPQLADVIAQAARDMNASTAFFEVGAPGNGTVPGLDQAIAEHDCTIYLSRLGDQQRFDAQPPGRRGVMSYARTMQAMASRFATTRYQAFCELKKSVDELIRRAETIELTCQGGTRLTGTAQAEEPAPDVGLLRFPMGVHAPIDASRFEGEVVLTRYLTPTGSRVYDPPALPLPAGTRAIVRNSKIIGWKTDDQAAAQAIDAHYDSVASTFGLQPRHVHSFHAGIHPGCDYPGKAATDPDLWSNTVFNSPRFAHFHTCGEQPPGEICWMVADPTIRLDSVALWENGRLWPERFDLTEHCLSRWPELVALFETPATGNGLD